MRINEYVIFQRMHSLRVAKSCMCDEMMSEWMNLVDEYGKVKNNRRKEMPKARLLGSTSSLNEKSFLFQD